jgi:AAA family ATPase
MYAERLPIPIQTSLERIAKVTEGLSGRDLRERILKEALHQAITEESPTITEDIVNKVLAAIKTKSSPNYTI